MLRTLIVDDEPNSRLLLEIVLGAEAGIEVVGQSVNGRQAIADASRLKPDVIVMDGEMPLLDGPAATRAIRDMYPEMLIIAHSSSTKLGDEMRRAGAFAVVEKTGDLTVLIDAMEDAKRAGSGICPGSSYFGRTSGSWLVTAR